jgi:hypothetical protein
VTHFLIEDARHTLAKTSWNDSKRYSLPTLKAAAVLWTLFVRITPFISKCGRVWRRWVHESFKKVTPKNGQEWSGMVRTPLDTFPIQFLAIPQRMV